MDSGLSDFPLCAPPSEMELDDEDDTIPWMNFPIVEPFNDGYCSGLLPELGVARKETSLVSMERTSIQQDSVSKVRSSVTELDKLKIGDRPPLMQSQCPLPRPGNSEFTHSDSIGSKLPSSSSSGLMNFPYFSRLASLSGVNVRNTAIATDAVICSSKQRACDKKSGASTSTRDHMEPFLVKSSYQETVSHVKLSMPQQAEALSVKAGNNEKSLDTVPSTIMVCDERIPEPVVATSSLCSGNRFESASNDPAYSLKRKLHETGDSEGSSDEAEEESVGRSGFKRGRAAEVHNLSERRRRERINKKMRALQQLIPSGNKGDKASMLDEAIEYLRTLQLQVQILSMGSGMYMPPMMLPASMQQMCGSLMPQFSPMGIGMNMHDVNFSMPCMPSIQAPCYPVSGPPFLGHLGQELLMSMPPVPPPLFGSSPVRLPVGNVSAMPATVDLPLSAPSAGSSQMIENVSSRKILNDEAKISMNDDFDQANGLLNNQYQDDDAAQNPGSTKRRRLACE